MNLPTFETPALARTIETLPPDAIDALPFGAIRLDDQGNVVLYSKAEARLSGHDAGATLGRSFFTEIAPCMSHASFQGKIQRALETGTLDIEFNYVGDFDDAEKELSVRVQSATGGGCWIFMKRE